ncbi:MAG TPA: hypothetical protein VMC09_17955 [Anaerolineales bacterium]|nr:hypothetical protein [Anaerolineales bacterium]
MPTIESTESSSPIVTRAVAAGLRGEFCDNYEFPGWQRGLLTGLGVFPQSVARFAISRFQSISGLPQNVLDRFSMDELIRTRLDDYAQLAGPFPAICLGAALGGATSYLSLALGGPFLPQAFVVTLKRGSFQGNVNEYLQRSLDSALRIAEENPELMTVQHYDPVHDGWLTRFVNHLRFKLVGLPDAYKQFIRSKLTPGGAVVFLDGGASWLRYRVGPRSVFQVGGWGGVSAEEFLESSDRLRAYARRTGLKYTDWKLNNFPLERGPESEWGSEPGLAEALEAFCKAEGYRFVRVQLPHPNDFSRLAFRAAEELLAKESRSPAGVSIEMFSQFDATSVHQSGLLPLWLIFNTDDSLEYLKEMRARFPKGKPIFFSPLSTFSVTPDLVPFQEWAETLSAFPWTNIGARPSHYPSDSKALVQWVDPLREWVEANRQPIQAKLTAEELAHLANQN